MRFFCGIFGFVFLWGCGAEKTAPHKPVADTVVTLVKGPVKAPDTLIVKQDTLPKGVSELEKQLREAGLVNVQELDSTIVVDLKYSGADNFLGIDVYGDFEHAYLQADVAQKLVLAEKYLQEKHPGYALLIYDAVRPLRIQQLMWDTLKMPPGEKTKYLSNPGHGSLHNYGAAVDLGIVNEKGIPLDMGTGFDFFGEKAQPVKEQELLASGELNQQQIDNRRLLRSVMYKAGFFGIQTEWWHFNSCRRDTAAVHYKIIE